MEFKEGDEIEIVENPSYFWDKIKPGMRGIVTTVLPSGGCYISVLVPNHSEVSQSVSKNKLNLIRKVKKEIRKSGFTKFIQRVDSFGT